jgi:hypothetical protein
MEKLQDEGELKTYTLRTCTDIRRRIVEWNETVNELEANTGEEKGMVFTAFPRKQILKAVDELFEMTKGRKWGRNNDNRLVVVS